MKLVFSSRWSKVKQAMAEEDEWIFCAMTNCGQRMRNRTVCLKIK